MTFEIFVSFRGLDTRRTFVSHLLLSLSKKMFRTCKSEEEIPENQPASTQVLWAIKNSEIAIVVISKNYTASVSCLDELATIMECKEKQSLEVLPVLYEVDPSDVLRQADDLEGNSYGDNNLEKVKRWRDALLKSIQIYRDKYAQWEDEDSYSYIIDEVVSFCFERLRFVALCAHGSMSPPIPPPSFPIGFVTEGIELIRAALRTIAGRFLDEEKPTRVKPRPTRSSVYMRKDKYVSDYSSLVGMDRHMKEVYTLLDLDLKDQVREIGICGRNGVGKTTLARCVYEQISPQFQDHYYCVNDRSNDSPGLDPTCFLDELTRAALTRKSEWESESNSFYEVVKAELGHRKVLLIVDDLLFINQLQSIRKYSRWFGPGSRLIFITSHEDWFVKPVFEHRCKVESLNYDEALQLFSQFAFKQEHVPRDYYRLSVRAVSVTGRIPLTLKLFGSYLRGKFIHEWESELCKLEASQESFVAKVYTCIGNGVS